MDRALRSLHRDWARHYAIGGAVVGGETTWTAVSLDGQERVFTAPGVSGWVDLAVMLREDHGRYPAAREESPAPDWALTRVRRAYPGFAVVAGVDGTRAYRGGECWPPAGCPAISVQAVGCLLDGQRADDARVDARLLRA